MPQDVHTIPFAEFGKQFMELVVTAEMIGQSLQEAISKPISINEDKPKVSGTGQTELGSVQRIAPNTMDAIVFDVPLVIHLTLNIEIDVPLINVPVGQENYEIAAEAHLHLLCRTGAPLVIFVEAPALTAAQVHLVTEGKGNWFNLAQAFGDLENKLKTKIADQINTSVNASDRVINVLDKVRASMGPGSSSANGSAPAPNGGAPSATGGSAPAAPLLKRKQTIQGVLAADQKQRYHFPPNDTDSVVFTIYAHKTEPGQEEELAVSALDAEGGMLEQWHVATDLTGEDWTREEITFINPQNVTDYYLRVVHTPPDEGASTPLEYKIKVE